MPKPRHDFGFMRGRILFMISLARWSEPYWWTRSAGGQKCCHLLGLWFERDRHLIIGINVGPLLFRLGIRGKE